MVSRVSVCIVSFMFSFCSPLTLPIREDFLSLLLSCNALGPWTHNILSKESRQGMALQRERSSSCQQQGVVVGDMGPSEGPHCLGPRWYKIYNPKPCPCFNRWRITIFHRGSSVPSWKEVGLGEIPWARSTLLRESFLVERNTSGCVHKLFYKMLASHWHCTQGMWFNPSHPTKMLCATFSPVMVRLPVNVILQRLVEVTSQRILQNWTKPSHGWPGMISIASSPKQSSLLN